MTTPRIAAKVYESNRAQQRKSGEKKNDWRPSAKGSGNSFILHQLNSWRLYAFGGGDFVKLVRYNFRVLPEEQDAR